MTTLNWPMQQRRGTVAQWLSVNPVLRAGEIGIEDAASPADSARQKTGDGETAWVDLPYSAATPADLDATVINLHLQPEIAALQWKTFLGSSGVTSGSPTLTGTPCTSEDVGKIAILLMDSATLQWWMTTIVDVTAGTVTFAGNAPSTKTPVRVYYGHNFNDVDGVDVLNDKLAEIAANPLLPKRVVWGPSPVGPGGCYRGNYVDNPQNIFLEAAHISGPAHHFAGAASTTVLAQLPGAERDFVTHNPDPLTGWIDRCGFTDFTMWGPETNVIGIGEATTGNGVFYGDDAGNPLSVGDGYRTGGVTVNNFPENGYYCRGAIPFFFKENKALYNAGKGFAYEATSGSTANVVSLWNFSGDWNNDGLIEFKDLKDNDTVSLWNTKSEANVFAEDRAAEFVGLRGGPNYQKKCIIFDSCDNPVVSAELVSHIMVGRALTAPDALFNIVNSGSVRLTYSSCNVRLLGNEVGSVASAVLINDEVRGVTVPRTVNSGYYGDPAAYEINGNASKPCWTSALGGSSAGDGADTWTKVCTLSPGTTQNTDACLTWSINPANTTLFEPAIISIALRTNATGVDPSASAMWLAKNGAANQLYANSFKVVAGAFGTDFEVWMKKRLVFCRFTITELSRGVSILGGWRISYNPSPAWQSTEPTGAALNAFSANTPNIGTPALGTLTNCTGLPPGTGLVKSTTDAVGFGTIELGHASDATLSRSAAGKLAVEGVDVLLSGGALGTPSSGTLTNATGLPVSGIAASTSTALGVGSVEIGHATDTTLSRSAAGVLAVEGVDVVTVQSLDAALTTGQETFSRRLISASSFPSTNGNERYTFFTARKSETVTQIAVPSGGTAGAGSTLQRIGLYTVDGSGNLTLVASTANDTTLWIAANTMYTKSLSVSYAVTRGTRYAVGLLVVGSSTAPTFLGCGVGVGAVFAAAPRLAGFTGGKTDLDGTVSSGSFTDSAAQYYAVLLP